MFSYIQRRTRER